MKATIAQTTPPKPASKFRRLLWAAVTICSCVIYFLLLGPFWALDSRGLVAQPISRIVWAPARLLAQVHFFRNIYVGYLDLWAEGIAADVLVPP